jgi:hypothetical protein
MARALRTSPSEGERGSILIETVVSAAILVCAVLGTLGVVDAARSTVSTAQRASAAGGVAQREMEALRAMPYAALFDCGTIATGGTGATRWVAASSGALSLLVQQDYRRNNGVALAGVASTGEPFSGGTSCSSTAGVTPSATFTAGTGITGTVSRYVTDVRTPCASTLSGDLTSALTAPGIGVDASAGTSGLAATLTTPLTNTIGAHVSTLCGAVEAKRLTVVATVDAHQGGPGPHQPIYLSSLVADPETGQVCFGVVSC